MKHKGWLILIVVVIMSAALVGCGEQAMDDLSVGQESDSGNKIEKSQSQEGEEVGVTEALKERAKAEGVSEKEMQSMIETLTKLTAEKFGQTSEAYIQSLEAQGKTPFDEFALAADMMGISIKGYVDYEKLNESSMTQDQKDTMAGMANALDAAADIDMEAFSEATEEVLDTMSGLTGGGDRVVSGHYRDIGHYKVKEIIEEDTTSEGSSGIYMVTYTSEADTAEIIGYFQHLFEGTPDYFCVVTPGDSGAQLTGTVNGEMVALSIHKEDGDGLTTIDYAYSGDFGMEVESSDSVVTHTSGESDSQDQGEEGSGNTEDTEDKQSDRSANEGESFDMKTFETQLEYPDQVAYVIIDHQTSSDGMAMTSTHYVTRSGWNVYVETLSDAFENRPVISIYNDELGVTVMYMKDAPDLKESYEGYYMMYDLYSLAYTVGGIGNYDSVTAYKIYDESDYMIDLNFFREGYEATVHYDKVANMVVQFEETMVEGGVTYTTDWFLESMDFDQQIDESLFDL